MLKAWFTETFEKVAIPLDAFTLGTPGAPLTLITAVPLSVVFTCVEQPESEYKYKDTVAEEFPIVFPAASSTATIGWVANAVPAVPVAEGCCAPVEVNESRFAPPNEMLSD